MCVYIHIYMYIHIYSCMAIKTRYRLAVPGDHIFAARLDPTLPSPWLSPMSTSVWPRCTRAAFNAGRLADLDFRFKRDTATADRSRPRCCNYIDY